MGQSLNDLHKQTGSTVGRLAVFHNACPWIPSDETINDMQSGRTFVYIFERQFFSEKYQRWSRGTFSFRAFYFGCCTLWFWLILPTAGPEKRGKRGKELTKRQNNSSKGTVMKNRQRQKLTLISNPRDGEACRIWKDWSWNDIRLLVRHLTRIWSFLNEKQIRSTTFASKKMDTITFWADLTYWLSWDLETLSISNVSFVL